MAMLKPSQSYSDGVIVDSYTGIIAQEMQFLSGEDRKKNQPHFNDRGYSFERNCVLRRWESETLK